MKFKDENIFFDELISFIFEEKNLLLYTKAHTGLNLKIGKKERIKLYQNIRLFLNAELESLKIVDFNQEIEKIIQEEYECKKENDIELIITQDKIGKIGEYILHIILSNYFGYECIIPKFRMPTNRNMSVFGIDALFFDKNKNQLLFGESKVSKSLKNGIALVNRSLINYEKSINEEYLVVLSNDSYKVNDKFNTQYREIIEECKHFDEFVKEANISTILVPIFIAHGGGNEEKIEKYLKELDKVNSKNLLGLETKYLLMSLPVINKEKFIQFAIKKAVEKTNEYE